MEHVKHNAVEEEFENSLLQTIRIPKNLLILTDKLPSANYDKNKNKKNQSFPNKKNLDSIKKNLTEGNEYPTKLPKKIIVNVGGDQEEQKDGKEKETNSPKKRIILKDPLTIINEEKKYKNNENLPPNINNHQNNGILYIINLEVSNKRPPSKIANNEHKNEKKNGIMLPVLKNVNYDQKESPSPKKEK